MQTEITQTLLEKVSTLPFEQQQKVLEFVEKLEKRATPLQRIGQIIDENLKKIPQEILKKLPTDGSENLEHYLYGAPKK